MGVVLIGLSMMGKAARTELQLKQSNTSVLKSCVFLQFFALMIFSERICVGGDNAVQNADK